MNLVRKRENWLPSVFDDFFNADWLGETKSLQALGTRIPAVNVKETENGFEVEVAAPGMKKEDFNVELNNDVLTISSETKSEHEVKDEKENYTRREFSYSSFRRSFSLPDSIDSTKIDANYADGVLKIALPKHEEEKVKAKRLIEVK